MLMLVYGTLKRGYGLNRCLNNSPFLGEDSVTGYSLRDAGAYPVAMRGSKQDFLLGEVYDVSDEDFAVIKSIEEGAGYWLETVMTDTGQKVSMWVSDEKVYGKLPIVEGGNW